MTKPFDSVRPKPAPPICGIVCGSSWHDPVACAWPPGHDGKHSWASLPALDPHEQGRGLVVGERDGEPNAGDDE